MSKKNCWEVMNCGREPGGANEKEQGVCPAAVEVNVDGVNGGKNGGRTCWTIAGTFCGGEATCATARQLLNCMECEFFKMVAREETDALTESGKIPIQPE